ncbi:triacylglycerol lipase [Streptomyces sp. NBC_00568]|uniref:esterase/lipase family protein n=1 Tax=Streptomyces sp. NBC_00568 TaxID=2975779 RepID=UPI00225BB087|nr:hypothetical protein [Streptomyces sp. NBC_00568]MCX4993464.1 hypothetical protein [Streptomyces sp. NBC_00568]
MQQPQIWNPSARKSRDTTVDAVVIVPGIMGSELIDAKTSKVLWGLAPSLLREALGRDDGLRALHVTEAELEGAGPARVQPSDLLRIRPQWLSLLEGIEPYHDLVQMVRSAVVDRAAMLEFAYDWRLSVDYNGRQLAEAARQRLEKWKAVVASTPALRARCQERMPQLVFVAHSMGGLVTRAALHHHKDLQPDTRTVITLGTPFLGSAKAAVMLNGERGEGRGPGRVRKRLQALAATLPSVHDLLPDYRCIDEGQEVSRLTPDVVEGIGGNSELARAAAGFQLKMRTEAAVVLPDHRAVAGVAQPTVQSVRIKNGIVYPEYRAFKVDAAGELVRNCHGIPKGWDRWGDGTVYRDAATNSVRQPVWMPVQHGALAKHDSALKYIHSVLTEYDGYAGPPMGPGELGLDLPDEGAVAGEAWELRVTGRDSPVSVTCEIVNAETGICVARPRLSGREDDMAAMVTLREPGLYRVAARVSEAAPVTQLVMAFRPDEV